MNRAAETVIAWTEAGLVPDTVIRAGIRRLNSRRLVEIHADDVARASDAMEALLARMDTAEIAPVPQYANLQHYELPAGFFSAVLGRRMKYSCGYWDGGATNLDEAEEAALDLSCRRAGIQDGQEVLDLGCGWGSLSLWIAERYPATRVLSVSNSASQRAFIEARAAERGLANVRVLTEDMNHFATRRRFDRIVSVEMFEHMRNYRALFRRIAGWLAPEGRFFMHIFCHKSCAYEFTDRGPSDWMSRHFFTGGMMPSADLPLRFPEDLLLEHRAHWSGRNYERTANAWLERLDAQRDALRPLFQATYGERQADQWLQRWRIFFMACAELFGHAGGQEWFVSHYLFRRSADAGKQP